MAATQAPETSQKAKGALEKSTAFTPQHHILNQEEDPWSDILEYILKDEQARCEAWKDEVNNLLVFAGLFSAIITTFLLDSYKSLTRDPNEVTIVLLSRIISQLQNTTDTTQTSSPDIPFSPTASAKRINVFWFLSLVLSLAAVLISTIGLQWLRLHRRALYGVKPQTAVSLIQMQSMSLDEWFVPQIFAALPLLLQIALTLFLSGIVEFLWHINRLVSYFILVAVCLLFLFLLLLAFLPALQEVFPMRSKGKMVPSPCPYNLPQSRWILSIGLYAKRYMIRKGFMSPSPSAFHSVCTSHTDGEHCQRHQVCWLYYRDLDTNRQTSRVPPTDGLVRRYIRNRRISSLYDAMRALHRVRTTVPKSGAKLHEWLDSILSECRDAEGDIMESDRNEFRVGYLRHIIRLLRLSSPSDRLPDFPPSSNHDILEDEIHVRFSGRQEKFLFLTDRIVAAHILLTKWIMFEKETSNDNASSVEWDEEMELPLERIADIDLSEFPVFIEASRLTIETLKDVLNYKHTPNDNRPRYISRFLPEAAKVLAKALPVNDPAQEEHRILLDAIASGLEVEESSSSFEPNPYLYLTTSRYVARLESERDRHSPSLQLPELERLDSVLEKYRAAISKNDRSKQIIRDLAERLSLPAYLRDV